jgi:hypothetical protein
VVVPRRWLIALAAVFVAPWLVAGALYWRESSGHAAGPDPAPVSGAAVAAGEARPWGQLLTTPIVISPPLDYVPSNWGPIMPPEWRFPQIDRANLERFLATGGLSQSDLATLMAAAAPDPRINGFTIKPSVEFVKNMDPAFRAALYSFLTKLPLNERQAGSYRFYGQSADDWFRAASISPATVALVKPWVYGSGDFVYFADIDLARREISDAQELQRLAKVLFRQSTLLAKLTIPDTSQVAAIAEYWGRGGRRTDIRPLLESIAAQGADHAIDISHLLPPLPRQYLYRYPRITLKELSNQSLPNCFWTAMNFFNSDPDDRFTELNYTLERLKRDYYIVQDQFQLGDVIMFADGRGSYFHAAVYLADNLVFGKNGKSSLSPWTIIPMERLKGFYPEFADDWHAVYYRRNDF